MKKLLSLILTVFMALTLNMVAFADNADVDGGRVEVSLEYIIDDWIDSNYQNDVNVSRIVGLCDPDDTSGKNIGHLVSFEKDGRPSGYIVLSREEDDYPIVEFAIEGDSVYDRLETQISANNEAIALACCDNKKADKISPVTIAQSDILYTDFVNYSLAIKNGEKVMLFNQNNQVQEFTSAIPNDNIQTYAAGMDDGYIVKPSESTTFSYKTITGGSSGVGEVMGDLAPNEGNCGPTAATNIIKLYANYKLNGNSRSFPILLSNDSIDYTYRRLATLCNYVSGTGTVPSDIVSGLSDYCSERGRTYSADKYSYNYWSDFTRDVGKNVPILLATYAANGDGHAQVIVGYREYSNGNKYLMSYTGWTSYATYIKFKASCFTGFYGWAIYIS